MIIQTISKQHTGGATEKKDQPESAADGRSVNGRGTPLKTQLNADT